jgi:hypothetical protein
VLEQINLSDPNKAERSWFGCPSKGNQKIWGEVKNWAEAV